MQVLEKRSLKNSAMWNPSLRSLRPLRETHSVSFPVHFPTSNSEEPKITTRNGCEATAGRAKGSALDREIALLNTDFALDRR
jgi:hypothetical protein